MEIHPSVAKSYTFNTVLALTTCLCLKESALACRSPAMRAPLLKMASQHWVFSFTHWCEHRLHLTPACMQLLYMAAVMPAPYCLCSFVACFEAINSAFRLALTILGFWYFRVNFRTDFPVSAEKQVGVLFGIALNLENT